MAQMVSTVTRGTLRLGRRRRTGDVIAMPNRLRAGVAAILVAAGATAALVSGPAGAVSGVGVATRTVTFVDHTRGTPSLPAAHLPARNTRTLSTTLWYPTGHGRFPLIVFGHGNGSNAHRYEPLLRAWADQGYVVAAPDFPVSSKPAPGVASVSDVSNQPGDLSFVISQVLALDRANHGLGHIVDGAHIGAAGHSLGAVTTLALVFRPCCRDRRVSAAISLSGTPLIVGTTFRGIRTPVLFVHGDADQTINYSASAVAFQRAAGPKFLLTILGGGHDSYLAAGDVAGAAVVRATIDFWDAYLKHDAGAVARLASDAAVPSLTTLQSGNG